ncbi:acyl-CoA thioester hydrolase/BAAT C-terminal domain-containing protein [Staphylococcus chromogenes]|nr:acyl-CoA thioester hydrolase/BAAT C-terminal domain-containing protein [Staphylococcus chromogenes]
MKFSLKILGLIIAVILLFVAVLAGVHVYNAKRYALPDIRSLSDSYETNDHVKSISGAYLSGFHFSPVERKHLGTVVVFGGSEGSPSYEHAKALFEQGYEVLALYFFGQPNQQQELVDVPLEFFDEVTAYINGNVIEPKPVTVIGKSKGAELVANLAARGAAIDNIVLYTPSSYTYQGLSFDGQPSSSFTHNGSPVPFVNFQDSAPSALGRMLFDTVLGLPVSYRPLYESASDRTNNSEDARIPIENFAGNGVLFAGDQDTMWQGDIAARELSQRNPRLDAYVYSEAGHLFSQDITTLGKGWQRRFGGTVEGNRAAKQESDLVLREKLNGWHPVM